MLLKAEGKFDWDYDEEGKPVGDRKVVVNMEFQATSPQEHDALLVHLNDHTPDWKFAEVNGVMRGVLTLEAEASAPRKVQSTTKPLSKG